MDIITEIDKLIKETICTGGVEKNMAKGHVTVVGDTKKKKKKKKNKITGIRRILK
jgi:hypothetical protein